MLSLSLFRSFSLPLFIPFSSHNFSLLLLYLQKESLTVFCSVINEEAKKFLFFPFLLYCVETFHIFLFIYFFFPFSNSFPEKVDGFSVREFYSYF